MKLLRIGGYVLAAGLAIAAATYAAFQLSPWPSVLLIRHAFHKDAVERNRAHESLRPAGVTELPDQRYGNGADELLDVYFPARAAEANAALPTIVWIHGGAFIAGDKVEGDARLADFAVNRNVTADFPPTFVSAGNADPLAPQSVLMADALRSRKVSVDALFFPKDYAPPLQHEYQFDVRTEAGRTAFERLNAFLEARAR